MRYYHTVVFTKISRAIIKWGWRLCFVARRIPQVWYANFDNICSGLLKIWSLGGGSPCGSSSTIMDAVVNACKESCKASEGLINPIQVEKLPACNEKFPKSCLRIYSVAQKWRTRGRLLRLDGGDWHVPFKSHPHQRNKTFRISVPLTNGYHFNLLLHIDIFNSGKGNFILTG